VKPTAQEVYLALQQEPKLLLELLRLIAETPPKVLGKWERVTERPRSMYTRTDAMGDFVPVMIERTTIWCGPDWHYEVWYTKGGATRGDRLAECHLLSDAKAIADNHLERSGWTLL